MAAMVIRSFSATGTTSAVSTRHAAPRRQDIEALRLLSCWGIVSFHVRPAGAAWAYGGLVAFIVLSVYLGGAGAAQPPWGRIRQRARRLLLPWALWAAAYGGLNLARGGAFWPADHGLLAAVLAGPSIHLWYLPFMFACLLALDALRWLLPPRLLSTGAGLAAVAVVATVPLWRPLSLHWHYPWLQWMDALAPLLVGVFLSGAAALPRAQRLALYAALGLAVAWVCSQEWLGPALLLGLGATALVASGRTAGLVHLDLTPLSGCTFGIYLVHIAVWTLLLDHGWAPPRLLPEAIVLISLGLVAALRRIAPRWASVWS